MASSSSSVRNKSYRYGVFLSFRGEDTRKTFVDHLYAALDQHAICTFKDDERLEKGKKIDDELLQSIEDSRCYIIVFSKNYASSSSCLNELLKIMECHKKGERFTFPVFYDVEPTEVRNQTGSVGKSLAMHTNEDEQEVRKWREALKEAADLCGWDVRKTFNGYEAKVIKLIVERVSLDLRYTYTDVDEKLVGMEKRMQDLDPCLEIGKDDHVRMIGIKGHGGAGKTTLAWAIFNKILMNFEGKSFVENVRDKASKIGLEKLQEQVLRDVLKDKNIIVSGVHEGRNLMKNKLRGKKVLVVLDDVDDINQLKTLVGDTIWFNPGSRIIITTRDRQVLEEHKVKWIHDVSLLLEEEAICLFSRHAFGKDITTQGYEKQSGKVVSYAAGLPLTIQVLGSKLCCEWTYTLERLKTIPLKETLNILELSYENLENDHKEMFLDVACFLSGWKEDDAIRLLESYGVHARNGLRVLEKKTLLTINKSFASFIQMHDHLVELGKNIVRRENPYEPNKHSRLWVQEEIEQVLASDSGSETVRCIDLKVTRHINLKGLGNMKKLRCLIAHNSFLGYEAIHKAYIYFPNSLRYLNWHCYPYRCLPNTFEADNLVALKMDRGKIEQLCEGGKVMNKLKFLNLSNSKLSRLDLGMTPNLERLDLKSCHDLVKLDVYGGCLKSLAYLNVNGCKGLESIHFIEQLESLEILDIGGLNLKEFPEYIITWHTIKSLQELNLSFNYNIEEVPSSIRNLRKLVSLDLSFCYKLKSLPEIVWSLRHLRTLKLQRTGIKELPEDLGQLELLEYLELHFTSVKHLPGSVCMLKRLKTLLLFGCELLEKLPEDVGQLESLEILDLEYCGNLKEVPNNICKLKCLRELKLQFCCSLEKLPEEVGNLKRLQLLTVVKTGLIDLPRSLSSVKGLKIYRSEKS